MKLIAALSLAFASCLSACITTAICQTNKPKPTYIELTGRATDVRVYEKSVTRPSYKDPNDKPFFVFEMKDGEGKVMGGKPAVIIGRHTTRYYGMKVSPTYTQLKPDWKSARVRVIGRLGIDNPFAAKGGDPGHVTHFPEAGKLPADRTITAYIVELETAPNKWSVWYYNNWFHGSEDEIANTTVTRHYAERKLTACTNEPLEVLNAVLSSADRQRLVGAGFKRALLFGQFDFDKNKMIRLKPSHFYVSGKKTTLGK